MRGNRLSKFIAGAAMLLVLMPGGASAAPGQGAKLNVQCMADQKSVGKGGTIGYHILYHNVDNQSMSKAWLKVKVPEGLEVEAASGANWNVASRILQWNLKDIKAKGADVLHFNLKVKADAKEGSSFDMACAGGVDADLGMELPPVRVVLGTELHQPVFNGYPDGGFHPAASLTRAETAAVIARLSNLTGESTTVTYSDVTADHWAAEYIRKVTAAGYMTGNEGRFRPEQPISRAEFVALILKVRGVQAFPLPGFLDAEGHWASEAAATAKALRLMEGSDDDAAALELPVNRDVAAKWLSLIYYRGALQDGAAEVVQHWPDVPKRHWSFGWVEELSLIAHEGEHKAPMKEDLIRYLPDQTEPF
ncbi:S-layer homology domain-containing protein [Paenibacillus sp. GD4]|uniref:S-layer homology domain-containing protein n=1 Tax=Paenibacillus sp. GD4 TaxID=3068890 RepID=UPI002796B77F|nr:S-layer homology domain-containing protein [Paenibacillus sp. GD4]MDQ1911790.1 S-layer homology domain-containing protein [Paenibacillus sp. GD4]